MSSYKVYIHISPEGKKYIGITKMKVEDRWQNGYGYKYNNHFYNAIKKYGWDNFKHIVLFESLTKEEACAKEIELISKYKSTDPEFGYNISTGGETNAGYHHSEFTKNKLRQRTIEQFMNEESRKKLSEKIKKLWENGTYSDMSEKHKGQKAWNKGLTKDDLRIQKFCRKKGEWHPSEEAKLKMSLAKKGKSPCNCKKIRCIETEEIFNSIAEAQRIKKINNISGALKNKELTRGGYHWECLKED